MLKGIRKYFAVHGLVWRLDRYKSQGIKGVSNLNH